jgi:hypothetical protein
LELEQQLVEARNKIEELDNLNKRHEFARKALEDKISILQGKLKGSAQKRKRINPITETDKCADLSKSEMKILLDRIRQKLEEAKDLASGDWEKVAEVLEFEELQPIFNIYTAILRKRENAVDAAMQASEPKLASYSNSPKEQSSETLLFSEQSSISVLSSESTSLPD